MSREQTQASSEVLSVFMVAPFLGGFPLINHLFICILFMILYCDNRVCIHRPWEYQFRSFSFLCCVPFVWPMPDVLSALYYDLSSETRWCEHHTYFIFYVAGPLSKSRPFISIVYYIRNPLL